MVNAALKKPVQDEDVADRARRLKKTFDHTLGSLADGEPISRADMSNLSEVAKLLGELAGENDDEYAAREGRERRAFLRGATASQGFLKEFKR